MKVVICIKPVKTELVYPNEHRNEKYVVNPYDLKVLKNLVELKSKMDCTLVCLCMGTLDSEEVLIKVLAMGGDEAILLNDNAFGGSDTVATTYVLAKAIEQIGDVNLVICGEKSVDGETGQVAYGIAERLKYESISQVNNISEIKSNHIIATQKSNGIIKKIRILCPVVVAYLGFSMDNGKISLLELKKARRKGISIWDRKNMKLDLKKCGIAGSKTKVLNVKNELIKKQSIVIQGEARDKASTILGLILNKKTEMVDNGMW